MTTIKKLFSRPVPCALLALLGWIILANIAAALASIPGVYLSEQLFSYVICAMDIVLLGLYVLWIKKRLGNGFVIGVRTDNLGAGLGMLWIIIFIIGMNILDDIGCFADPIEISSAEIPLAVFGTLLNGLHPGITEEFMLRVIVMGIIMHMAAGKKYRLQLAVGVSSGLFGLFHILNFFGDAPPIATMFQILYATGFGILFAGAYARTRNIIAPIIAHSLVDITSNAHYLFYPSIRELSNNSAVTAVDIIQYILVTVLSFAVGLYLLRPSKRHEIEAHWGSLSPAATPDVNGEAA